MSLNSDSLHEVWKTGEAKPLEWFINRGVVRTSVVTYLNIFDHYKKLREAPHSLTYLQAVARTAEDMNTSPETVKRAVAEVM